METETETKLIPWAKLPKKDKKHLRAFGVTTKVGFLAMREKQQVQITERVIAGLCGEVCWDCRMIATKLGVD